MDLCSSFFQLSQIVVGFYGGERGTLVNDVSTELSHDVDALNVQKKKLSFC